MKITTKTYNLLKTLIKQEASYTKPDSKKRKKLENASNELSTIETIKTPKNHNQFIRCLENIQDLSLQKKYNYAMLLAGGGAFSRKTIKYDPKTKKYYVTNHIDESKQIFTGIELINNRGTLIGKAISMRSLIALID